jgi:hypothetical protein
MVTPQQPDDSQPATLEALVSELNALLPVAARLAAHARRRQNLRGQAARRLSRRHVEALAALERSLSSLSDQLVDLLDADGAGPAAVQAGQGGQGYRLPGA